MEYIWPKISLTWRSDKNINLTQSLTYGGTPDQSLTKCQPDLKPHLGGTSDQRSAQPTDLTKMSTWPKATPMGVYLTIGQPDPKIWQKCQPDAKPHLWGSVWLSAKRTSENLNTLCILGVPSQRSFLWKTNKKAKGLMAQLTKSQLN